MRKNISVTNDKVIELLDNSLNASEVIEIALLYYMGEISKEYVENYKTLQDVSKTLKSKKNKPI
jgi:predicted Zn-ribbon and HTH transcriptional regulator